jgi:uncharacterized protein (DUF1501 family)
MKRQIFFCSLGGFDTHNGQVTSSTSPTTALTRLSWHNSAVAMRAFYDATVTLGVSSQVTTFTLSDFSRTFVPNGTLGSDHAWGAHHFVMGGAVRGGTSTEFRAERFRLSHAGTERSRRYGSGNERSRTLDSYSIGRPVRSTLASWFACPARILKRSFRISRDSTLQTWDSWANCRFAVMIPTHATVG